MASLASFTPPLAPRRPRQKAPRALNKQRVHFVYRSGSDHPPSHSLLGLALPHQDKPSENTPAITVNPAPVAGIPDGMITTFRVSTYEPPPRSNAGAHELQNNSKMLFHVGEEDMTKLVERVPAHTSTSSVDSASTSTASNASLPTITSSLAHPVPAPIHTSSSSSTLLPLTLPVSSFWIGYPAPPPTFASSPSLSCTSLSSLSTGNCTSAGASTSEIMPETRLRQRNDSKRKRETYCMQDENLTIADQAEPNAHGIKNSTAQGQGNRIVHESGEKSPKRHRAEARLPLSPQKNREHMRTETRAGTMTDGGPSPVRRCIADLVVASRQRAATQGSTVDERDVRVDATNESHRGVLARDERIGRISKDGGDRAATHWPSGRMAAEVTSSYRMAERHPVMVQDDQMTGGGQWLWPQRQTQLGDEHAGEWAATTEDNDLLNETNEVGNRGWPSQGWYPDESRSGYVHPSGDTFGSVQPDSDRHTFQAPSLRQQSPGLLASERSAALDRALFSSTIAGPSTPAGNEQQALAPAYSCEHASTLHHRPADADPLLHPQTLPDGRPLAHQREYSSRYRPLDLMQAHLLDCAPTTSHSFELMYHSQPLAQPRIELQLMDMHCQSAHPQPERARLQPTEVALQPPQLSARPHPLHEYTGSPEPAEERSVRYHWTSDPRVRLHRVCTAIDVNGCGVAPGVVRVDGREGATAAAPVLRYPHGGFSPRQTRADAPGISSRTTTPMTPDRSRNGEEGVAKLDASAVTAREVGVMAMDGSGAETDVIDTNTRGCASEVDRIEVQTRGTAGNPCVVDAASGVGPGMDRSASSSLGVPNRVSTASRDSPNREITSVDSGDNENVHVTTPSRCQNIATVITKESGGVAATTRATSTAHEVIDVDTLNEAGLAPSAAQRPMLGPIPLPPPYPYAHAMGPYLTVPHPNAHVYAYLPHTGTFPSPPHAMPFHPSLPNPSRFHNVPSYPPPSSIPHPHAYPHSLPFAYPPPLILPGRTPRTRPHDWAEVFLHTKKVGGFKPVRRAVRGRRPWVNATTDGDGNRQCQDSFPDNGYDGANREEQEEAAQTEGIGQSVTSERTDGDNSSGLRNNASSLVGLDGDLDPTARETEDTDSSSSADDEDLFDELFRNPKGEGERKEHHCPLCGRAFRLPNSLAIHLKWHWGATSLGWRRGLGRRGRIQERAKENSEARARELREEELREREWRLESGRETGGAAHDGYGAQQRDLEPSAIAAPICVSTFTPLTSPADVLFSSPAVANAGTKSSFRPPTVATAGLSLLSPTIRPPEASAFMMPIIAGAFDLGVGAPSSDAEGEEEGSLFGEDEGLFGGGGGDRLCPPPSESFLPAEPLLDSRYKVPSSTITEPGLTPELTLTSTLNPSEDRDGVLRRCTHRRHEPSWSEQLFGSDSDEEEHNDEQGPSSPASNAVEDRNQPESGLSPLTDFAALQLFP